MIRIFCIVVELALIQVCWAQTDVDVRDLPPSVGAFVELTIDHYIDKPWRKANINSIFHPNVDGLGVMPRYSGIQEILPIVNHGQALFLSAKVSKVLRARAWIDYTKPNKELEDALFVGIDYSVIATIVENKITVLEDPVKAKQYIVLAFDIADGRQKIIGIYPSLKKEQFVGAKYFLANFEELSGDINMKSQLENKIMGR